jgi:hypothetical protein
MKHSRATDAEPTTALVAEQAPDPSRGWLAVPMTGASSSAYRPGFSNHRKPP